MKTYIVKRLKDGQILSIGEKELQSTLSRSDFDGMGFRKQFELIGEEKNIEEDMAKLFGE